LNYLGERLKILKKASQHVCERLVKSRRDIVAVFVVGSVARGDIHEASDVDMCILVSGEDKPKRESIQKLGCKVDITYVPLRLWMERLRRDVGSMWEINASSILDSIILYDPTGLVQRIKQELSVYPKGERKENILHHLHMMGWYENAVKHHYLRKNYDVESIFSKLFAIEALRILFPLNCVYLRGDKYLFEQVKDLDRGCPNTIMAVISLIDGTSYLLYYLAFMTKSIIWLLTGVIIERVSFGLYPVYAVYEYEAYPREIREKAYVYHNVLPLASQAITYPLIGYVLSVFWPTWEAMLAGLLAVALLSYLSALLPLRWLPRLGGARPLREEEGSRGEIPRDFYPVAMALVLLGLANAIAPPLILVNLFKEVLGGGLFGVSLYEAVAALAVVTLSLPLLKVRKEWGKYMVTLGLGLICTSDIILVCAKTLELALVSAFLASAGYAVMNPFFMDILFLRIPEDKKGTLLGGIAGVRRIIAIASPAIADLLAETLFPAAPYLASAAAIAASILLILYAIR